MSWSIRELSRRTVVPALAALLAVSLAGTGTDTVAFAEVESGEVAVGTLAVNHLEDAIGIPTSPPVFSWQLEGRERGIVQSARQIQVATSADGFDDPDVWDSGRVEGRDSVNVSYDGEALEAQTEYHWRVRAWDGAGSPTEWSEPSRFETALAADAATAEAWDAEWIGGPPHGTLGVEWSDYTLRMRTSNITEALGIVFYADSTVSNTYMWQLSARGEPTLRPHSRVNGSWALLGEVPIPGEALPGGFAGEHEITIELADDTATTSIDGRVIDTRPIPLRSSGTLGFRSAQGESGDVEELTVTRDDETLFHTDFSDGVNPFAIGNVSDGRLRVSGVIENGVFTSEDRPLPLVRKDFDIDKPISSARLYSTALGVYTAEINGARVGDHELAPGWTDYSQLVQYQVYDVTELLQQGPNTIGVKLGTGWYAGHLAWVGPNRYGTDPAFLGRLEITHDDGTTSVVTSDGSWATTPGPIVDADILMGETYDFRREVPGWSEPGSASGWSAANVFTPAVGELQAQTDPPVRVTEERPVEAVTTPTDGVTIYDLGQNMVGWVRARLTGAPGDVLTIRHGEVLNPDGTLYTANLRSARATEKVTLGSDGTVEYSPSFVFHGFRYVEITGLASPPAAEDLTGIVVGTDNRRTSTFDTSDPMLNQLQSNIVWGVRGNFLSVPTDTPARDERLGYSGDLNVIVDTATFNHDAYAFLTKWLRDMRLRQAPNGALPGVAPGTEPGVGESNVSAGWGDAAVTVTHALWKQYGDTQVIDDNWQMMNDLLGFWTSVAQSGIVPEGHGIGDWLNLDDPTSNSLIATAYYAHDADLLSEMARATGRDEEADSLSALFDEIRAAFAARFIAADGTIDTGSQAAYTMSVGMGLVPQDRMVAVGDRLVEAIEARDWHLSTGFLGTPHLLPALSAVGRDDIAYRLLLEKEYPSWLYELTMGATTTWERWDSIRPDGSFQDPGMNSFNHYAYGAVGEWMYSSIAGITATGPGYSTFDVAPRPGGGLTHADVSHESPYGEVRSSWKQQSGHELSLDVTVPANTTALVHVPAVSKHAVLEGGVAAHEATGVEFVRMEDGAAVFEVGSGTYAFESDDVRGHIGEAADAAASVHRNVADLVDSGDVDRKLGKRLLTQASALLRAVNSSRAHTDDGATAEALDAARTAAATSAKLTKLIEATAADGSMATGDAEALLASLHRVDAALSAMTTLLLGVSVSLAFAEAEVVPGSTAILEATIINTGDSSLSRPALTLDLPAGWSATPGSTPQTVDPGASAVVPLIVSIGADEPIADDVALAGAVTYRRGQATITIPVTTVVNVVSPVEIVSVQADPAVLAHAGDSTTVTVTIRNRRAAAPLAGSVRFTAPDGWRLDPATAPYALAAGAEGSVSTSVTAPAGAELPSGTVGVTAVYGDAETPGDHDQVRVTSEMRAWNFETPGDTEGWAPTGQLTGFTVADGALHATSTGGDPNMTFMGSMFLDASAGAVVEITMTSSILTQAQLFWGTAAQPGAAESRSIRLKVEAGGPYVYRVSIPPQGSPLTTLRFDPLTAPGDIRIESIRVLR
ncbi:family 78 glycoside hydrolase catalytic domain [Agromyces ramosus]|uniref:alpha-L-rhamnosidase n=1 Tax=Agromyces ramosus TaxID=33879 RepID=A0ABU0RCZ2_9MICO|nr:family 78 glycoside hydrolase catalytic domain [Agromyces ramosus]MDQ0895950.1 alpha-L-rhamnosidase [Agromyces ramosus]